MAAHHHHLHEGESLREAAEHQLKARGEQWTEMRAAVFEALAEFDKPASAYDIAEAVSKRLDRHYRRLLLGNAIAVALVFVRWEVGLAVSTVLILSLLLPPATPRYIRQAPVVEGEEAMID